MSDLNDLGLEDYEKSRSTDSTIQSAPIPNFYPNSSLLRYGDR